jgi:hypothetical protein
VSAKKTPIQRLRAGAGNFYIGAINSEVRRAAQWLRDGVDPAMVAATLDSSIADCVQTANECLERAEQGKREVP